MNLIQVCVCMLVIAVRGQAVREVRAETLNLLMGHKYCVVRSRQVDSEEGRLNRLEIPLWAKSRFSRCWKVDGWALVASQSNGGWGLRFLGWSRLA